MAVAMKLYEAPTRNRYERNERWITRLLVEKNGVVRNAKDFVVFVQDVKAGGVPRDKTLHYHKKKETLFFVLSGRCVVNVEGEEYELKENSALWISSGEKHGLTKVLVDTKILEVLSDSGLIPDKFECDLPWHEEYPALELV